MVSDGKIKAVAPVPTGYGKQIISWHGHCPVQAEIRFTEKF